MKILKNKYCNKKTFNNKAKNIFKINKKKLDRLIRIKIKKINNEINLRC